jgi:hypothetical protein
MKLLFLEPSLVPLRKFVYLAQRGCGKIMFHTVHFPYLVLLVRFLVCCDRLVVIILQDIPS